MKSYVDLEQSKKLTEILPVESADMAYLKIPNSSAQGFNYSDYPYHAHLIAQREHKLPCWSLAALLELIPQEIFEGEYIINITKGLDNKWVITYDHYDNRNSFYGLSTSSDNLVDSCVDLLTKLKERNII